jgi:hypothetical protein
MFPDVKLAFPTEEECRAPNGEEQSDSKLSSPVELRSDFGKPMKQKYEKDRANPRAEAVFGPPLKSLYLLAKF